MLRSYMKRGIRVPLLPPPSLLLLPHPHQPAFNHSPSPFPTPSPCLGELGRKASRLHSSYSQNFHYYNSSSSSSFCTHMQQQEAEAAPFLFHSFLFSSLGLFSPEFVSSVGVGRRRERQTERRALLFCKNFDIACVNLFCGKTTSVWRRIYRH